VAIEGKRDEHRWISLVAPKEAGPIDNNAKRQYRNVNAKFDYAPNDRVNTFFRTGYFTENRVNGKVGEGTTQVDDGERRRQIRMPTEATPGAYVSWTSRRPIQLPGRHQRGNHTEHRPPGDRSACSDQRRGLERAVGPSHRRIECLQRGDDWRWVDGDSQEDAFVASVPR